MSNKREFTESKEDEPFMRRVEERRGSRYYIRKREETEHGKRKRDHTIFIRQDLVVSKILTRLPVKTLLRFQSVCKYWREATHDPQFISLHLEQSKKNPALLISPLNPDKQTDISLYKYSIEENINKSMKTANLMFKHETWETMHILDTPSHANGLILLGTPWGLVLCNPCTRELIRLPRGHRNTQRSSFGIIFNLLDLAGRCGEPRGRAALCYLSSSNSYKVVQYFYRHLRYISGVPYLGHISGAPCSVGLEILTLGGKKECLRWEVAEEEPPYPIDDAACPKAVRESVYFKINNRYHPSAPKAVLSYNVEEEKYRVVDLPPHYMTGFEGVNISDFGGDTCFTCIKDRSVIDVWVLSSKDFELYPKFSIDLRPLHVRFCEPVAVVNGKLLLHLDDGIQRLDYYNPETGCFENVALIARDVAYYEKENGRLRIFNGDSIFTVTGFVESLVPLEGSATN